VNTCTPYGEARIVFDRMPPETRRALFEGDLDLDDALDDDLGSAARHALITQIQQWGKNNVTI